MKFLYMGFTQATSMRRYGFESIGPENARKRLSVTADVSLLTKHRIQIQEAPTMCLRLLETCAEADPALDAWTLSEADMMTHVRGKVAEKEAAALKKAKRSFEPADPAVLGTAWRSKPLT